MKKRLRPRAKRKSVFVQEIDVSKFKRRYLQLRLLSMPDGTRVDLMLNSDSMDLLESIDISVIGIHRPKKRA